MVLRFLTLMILGLFSSNDLWAQGQGGLILSNSRLIPRSTSLVLLGKGVHAKNGTASLALACKTPACTSVSFVYFKSTEEAYFFGPTYSSNQPPEALVKSALKRKRSRHERRNASRSNLVLMSATFGSLLLVPITTIPTLVLLGVTGIVYLSGDQGNALESIDVVGAAKKESTGNSPARIAMTYNEGWNWASQPRGLRVRKFCETLASIEDIPVDDGNSDIDMNIEVYPQTFIGERYGYVNACIKMHTF